MYRYEDFKDTIASLEGQRALVKLLHRMQLVMKEAGCITAGRALDLSGQCGAPGDSWARMALVDHLVHTGACVRAPGLSDSWQGAVLFPVRE